MKLAYSMSDAILALSCCVDARWEALPTYFRDLASLKKRNEISLSRRIS